jgi:hypothetical protein
MAILSNGQFTITIDAQELARGLRPSKRTPRNSKFLVECEGAVGLDGVLQTLSDLNLSLIDPTDLGAPIFPYPQLFVFTNLILVCMPDEIFEYTVANGLTSVLDTITVGIEWSAVDFNDFIYMSNGKVTVVRNPGDGSWEVTTDYPIAGAMANYNGQVMLGAPGVEQV